MDLVFSIFQPLGYAIFSFWWLFAAAVLLVMFLGLWRAWRQFLFRSSFTWTLLEIKIPRENKKSPKAMEHIFANIHTLRNVQGNFREKWIDGEITQWFSFEIVSFGGDIHFYIRTPTRHTAMIRANFYAQYSDVEITEADDYVRRVPDHTYQLYEAGYDLWGAELFLFKGDAYPIRTYPEFYSKEEEENLDPIGGILEVLSKIDKEEVVMVQILARPADGRAIVAAIDAETEKIKKSIALKAAKIKGEVRGEEESGEQVSRTPGETDLLKRVEAKANKPSFDVMVRFVYLAPKSIYNVNFAKRGIRAAFYQFGAPNLNFFVTNPRTWTQAWIWDPPHIFPKRIIEGRKQRMLTSYKERSFPMETGTGRLGEFHIWSSSFTQRYSMMNTEELATIFHVPTIAVLTQPLMERVESRKIGPPAGLPIFQEERGTPGIMK